MITGPVEGAALPLFQPHPVYQGGDAAAKAPLVREPGTEDFAGLLTDAVARANALSHAAAVSKENLATGRTDDIHGTMIDVQKSSIETKLVGTVRNKIIDAFYELWRMSV